jgi:dynein heavy chain
MNMIFEVADLAVASPATVSRCGMVYLEPHQLGWEPLRDSWVNTIPVKERLSARVVDLMDWLLPPTLTFVRKELRQISPTSDTNLAVSLMRLYNALLTEFKSDEWVKATDSPTKDLLVNSLFVEALVWTVGGSTTADGRLRFDAFLRELCSGATPAGYDYLMTKKKVTLDVPMVPDDDGSSVFDWMFDKKALKWQLWTATITDEERHIPPGTPFSSIIVPTKDSARYSFLLDLSVTNNYPILFCGPTGTGKSVYLNRYLMSLDKNAWTPINITFSARTTANMTQDQVDGRLDKRRKGLYGPPMGKNAIVFVDDLNMPTLEEYGAQPPIELLRQFMDYSGWYGRDNVFRNMVDVQVIPPPPPPP